MWASGTKASGGASWVTSPSQSKVTFTDAAPVAQGANLTKIDFDTVVYDTLSEWDVATNHRFDVNATGRYHISARIKIVPQGAGFTFGVRVNVNGGDVNMEESHPCDQTASGVWVSFGGDLNLTAGDYVEVYIEQLSGGSTVKTYFAMCEIHRI
jgi:hypothetical protein